MTFTSLVKSFRKSTTARENIQGAIFGHFKSLWFVGVLGLLRSLSFAFTFSKKNKDFRVSPPLKSNECYIYICFIYLSLCPFLCLCERLNEHGLEGLQSFLFLHCRPVEGMRESKTCRLQTLINYQRLNSCTELTSTSRK